MLLLAFVLLVPGSLAVDVTSSNKIVAPGQSYDLNVSIDPMGTPIAGAQLDIAFNRSILRMNRITEGNLFKQKADTTFFNSGIINYSSGTVVNIFDAIIGKSSVSTAGTFIIINMTAIGSTGTSIIDLSNVKISDPNGLPVSLSIKDGNVTIVRPDVTPPASISSLRNTTYDKGYIRWNWNDPADADFTEVMVYINSVFKTKVTKGVKFYNATGLTPNAAYTISTHTVDASGNINKTWINHTARTAQSITSSITVVSLTRNPGFESGTASWLFYTNGYGTFTAASPGYEGTKTAKLVLNTKGTNVQLYQTGITLEPNTRYRLSFAAYSKSGNDMNVRLIKHVSPYNPYMPDFKADLSTNWQPFTTEFTTGNFTGTVNDGRLMFWLAPFAMAGDTYYIDDVRLEK